MTYSNGDLIDGDNPIASLSHDQKVHFTTVRYLGDLKLSRRNATKAIRTSEFDIPKHELGKGIEGQ